MQENSWHLASLDEDSLAVPYEWSRGNWDALPHYGYLDYPSGSPRTGAESILRTIETALLASADAL